MVSPPKKVIKIPLTKGIGGIFFSKNQTTAKATKVATISGGIATDKFLNEDKKIVVEMIREEMLEAAENLEFEKAAKLRDEMNKLEKEIKL